MVSTSKPTRAVFGDPASGGVRFGRLKRWSVYVEYSWVESDDTTVEVEACDQKEAEKLAAIKVEEDESLGRDEFQVIDVEAKCLDPEDEEGDTDEEPEPYWPKGMPKEQMRMFEE